MTLTLRIFLASALQGCQQTVHWTEFAVASEGTTCMHGPLDMDGYQAFPLQHVGNTYIDRSAVEDL